MEINKDIYDRRKEFDEIGQIYPPAGHVRIQASKIEDIQCYWFIPDNPSSDRKIIYLHGGGYIMGSIKSHTAMVSHLAQNFHLPVLFVEYSLAPENHYPAGVKDFLNVYRYLLQHENSKYIIIGDSAGAGILLSSLAFMKEENLLQPAGIIMISPWLDLECNAGSYLSNEAIDPIFTKSMIEQYASLYTSPENLSAANPIKIRLYKYPPALILVGTNEILLDDSKIIYNEIAKYQNLSKLSIYKDQSHVWPLVDINSEASKNAFREMNDFIEGL